jgi:hypothetical protein
MRQILRARYTPQTAGEQLAASLGAVGIGTLIGWLSFRIFVPKESLTELVIGLSVLLPAIAYFARRGIARRRERVRSDGPATGQIQQALTDSRGISRTTDDP